MMEPSAPPPRAAVNTPQPQQTEQQKLQQFLDYDWHFAHAKSSSSHATNDVSDIVGAKPTLKNYEFTNKPNLFDAHDISGSTSKQLHAKTRRIGNEDRFKQLPIEGAHPKPTGFRTNRVCNPLEPEYRLPLFKAPAAPVPRFLRDSYDVSDIEGTRAPSTKVERPRDPLKVEDIPGAQAGWKPRNERQVHDAPARDIMNVADITDVGFKSNRVTNVLNPVYVVNGFKSEDDPLSRPAAQHPKRNKISYSLLTQDIKGSNAADASQVVVGSISNDKRRTFRETNATKDIVGATADTVQHCIRTNRQLNPNDPTYRALDGSGVDSSSISTAKSVVFADLVHALDKMWTKDTVPTPPQYVVSGVGNIGQVNNLQNEKFVKKMRKRTSVPTCSSSNQRGGSTKTAMATAFPPIGSDTTILQQAEDKKRQQAKHEEIQSVRELI